MMHCLGRCGATLYLFRCLLNSLKFHIFAVLEATEENPRSSTSKSANSSRKPLFGCAMCRLLCTCHTPSTHSACKSTDNRVYAYMV